MSRNGAGTFNRAHDFTDDAAAAIKIRADRMDEEIDGIATALSASIANDGQTTILADLPMSTHKHTGVGNATARDQYVSVAGLQDGSHNWVAAGGTADAITATYAPALTALVDGQLCFVRAGAANATTTPTFAPNGLTAHAITKLGGSALAAGDIPAALAEITLRYNLANTRWELLNPASGNFLESAVASPGSTFSAGSGNAQNITTLSLTPGDWDVEGMINTSGGVLSNMQAGISSVSATQPATQYLNTIASASANGSVVAPRRNFSVSVTTTIYLVFTGFGGSTPTLFGYINARRVR